MVDDDDEAPYPHTVNTPHVSKVLHVIDIQSGDIFQRVCVDLQGEIVAVRVDGDEIFIADCNASKVVMLRYAGSEA